MNDACASVKNIPFGNQLRTEKFEKRTFGPRQFVIISLGQRRFRNASLSCDLLFSRAKKVGKKPPGRSHWASAINRGVLLRTVTWAPAFIILLAYF